MKMTNSTKPFLLPITLLLLTIVLLLRSEIQYANAKEIEATNEWQIVEEGDTIPAGLHVKMDLETGTKWVKLLYNEEDNSKVALRAIQMEEGDKEDGTNNHNNDSNKGTVKITQLSNEDQKIPSTVASKIQSQLLKQVQQEQIRKQNVIASVSKLNDFNGDMSTDESDYETIYRTLMSLPEEERVSLNIPNHPGDDSNDEELREFESNMKDIWAQRQDLLKKIEEEYLANIPDIIHDIIIFIQKYVISPIPYLKDEINGNDNVDGSIVQTLQDLEFHLMDLDMTRDFHTMGGWPLLVSLLTDDIHGLEGAVQEIILAKNWTEAKYDTSDDNRLISMKLTKEEHLDIQHLQEMIWKVQSLASWCIGTAVKNVHEFHPWALEDLSQYLHLDYLKKNATEIKASSSEINALSILLSKFSTYDNNNIIKASMIESPMWLNMKQKEIYALGALLRGNKDSALYFDSIHGPAVLSIFFSDIVKRFHMETWENKAVLKLLIRIMMLGTDLIADFGSENENLLSSLTNDSWCSMPMQLLMNVSRSPIQRQTIEAMVQFVPYCKFDLSVLTQLLQNAEDTETISHLKRMIGIIETRQSNVK